MAPDPERFRQVLSQYPTGVAAVTGRAADGTPVGMVVGSFTSVSLRPPLVAFHAAKSSETWPSIRDSGSFCVGFLGADQEDVCRALATRTSEGADKFRNLAWRPAASGSPLLDGVVGWIDCDIHAVHEAGDHYIVVGLVRELDAARGTLPLLFFRRGYGQFAPLSGPAPAEELVDQLRWIDLSRRQLDWLAADLDTECAAVVLARDRIVLVASAGPARADVTATPVGHWFPFMPPLGAVFAAWGGPAVLRRWLSGLDPRSVDGRRADCLRMVQRVREQGYTIGLGHQPHAEVEAVAGAVATARDPKLERELVDRLAGAELAYNPEDLAGHREYELRHVSAPVFGPDRQIAFELTAWGPSRPSRRTDIDSYVASVLAATRAATDAIGGRAPDAQDVEFAS